jgi:hypothetical protein
LEPPKEARNGGGRRRRGVKEKGKEEVVDW